MPSLVSVSGGDTLSNLTELVTCNLSSSDRIVTLLSSVKDYYRYIEIAVKACRSGGIDCKVHGLQVQGKRRSQEDEFSTSHSFLVSDSEVRILISSNRMRTGSIERETSAAGSKEWD